MPYPFFLDLKEDADGIWCGGLGGIANKRIRVGNLDVLYYFGGTGKPLLIIHGGGGGGEHWLKSAAELSNNFTVYVPDLPGFGQSQPIKGNHGANEFVAFLDEFASCVGLDSFYLAGHSMGGAIALRYTVKHPQKVKKLVLLNSIGIGSDMAKWIGLTSSPTLCRSFGRAAASITAAIRWISNKVCSRCKFANPLPFAAVLLGASMVLFRQEAATLVPQLASLMMPTLLVWGAKDKVVPVSNAYNAAKQIPGCQVYVFDDCGHSVYRDKAAEFVRLLNDFLL